MKNSRRGFVLFWLVTLSLLWSCAGGCGPGEISKTKDDQKDQDVCTGDACVGPEVDSVTGEVDIPVDNDLTKDETTPPDEVVDCNLCTEGEVKCDGEDRYYECVKKGECWKWSSLYVECKGNKFCACMNEPDGICTPADGEACGCAPDCTDKECGADGCGGTCGICEEGDCNLFTNKCDVLDCESCQSVCAEDETKCNGDLVQHCVDVFADDELCEPCWKFEQVAVPCPGDQACDVDVDKCVCAVGDACGEACCEEPAVCFGDACCTPACEGKDCGDDGCGGTCGTCGEGDYCSAGKCGPICNSDCAEGDKECNGDMTGYKECKKVCDDCGVGGGPCFQFTPFFGCEAGSKCVDGECVCQPKCTGKECGDDGCGGSCGTCEGQFVICLPNQKCGCDCEGQPLGTMCDLATLTEYKSQCEAVCDGAINTVKGPCPKCEDDCTEQEKQPMQICGFDMVTYDSFCDLKCTIGGPDCVAFGNCPQILYPGVCKPDCCEDQGCTPDYNPLCGTDGKTYCNKCALQVCGETDIACVGECPNLTACPDCGDECEPVCGLHNDQKKNYGNECLMECQGAELLWDGECCLNCDENEEWICASDGDLFMAHMNECFQNCQAPEQLFLYELPLMPDGTPWIELCEVCQCDISTYTPVCGDDFIEYASSCALECAFSAGIGPVTNVPYCEAACFTDECPCPAQIGGLAIPDLEGGGGIAGICGADGNTYGNACDAAKYGTFATSQIWCSSCADECGSDPYKPMCCDGVTYRNSCVADKCNSNINVADCAKGKCCMADADCDDGNEATADTCNDGVCENI
jgi:hypothetical protein